MLTNISPRIPRSPQSLRHVASVAPPRAVSPRFRRGWLLSLGLCLAFSFGGPACVSATGSEEVGVPSRRGQDAAGTSATDPGEGDAAGASGEGTSGSGAGSVGVGGDQGGTGSDLPGAGGSPFEDPGGSGSGGSDDEPAGGSAGDASGGGGSGSDGGSGGGSGAGGNGTAGTGAGGLTGSAGTTAGAAGMAGAGGKPEGDCPRVRVVVDASTYVNLRADASTTNPAIGKLYNGDILTCVGQVQGQTIEGNPIWFHLDSAKGKGFISATLGVCTKEPL
jgi:hypothetical protein